MPGANIPRRARGGIKALPSDKKRTVLRLVKLLYGFYPWRFPLVVVCILFSATVTSLPAIFMQKVDRKSVV